MRLNAGDSESDMSEDRSLESTDELHESQLDELPSEFVDLGRVDASGANRREEYLEDLRTELTVCR